MMIDEEDVHLTTALTQQYLDSQRFAASKADAIAAYTKLHDLHTRARDALHNFVTKCNERKPLLTLPRTLQPDLVRRAVLVVPAGADDSFYKETREALETADREATQKVYDALLTAKTKLVEHLAQLCKPDQFVLTRVAAFTAELVEFAKDYEKVVVDQRAAAAFQPQAAIDTFASYLQEQIPLTALELAGCDADRRKRVKTSAAAEEAAKDQVMAGATTGKTIADIATKAMTTLLQPVQKQLAVLRQQLNRADQRVANHAASASSASVVAAVPSMHAGTPTNARKRKEVHMKSSSQFALDPSFFITPATFGTGGPRAASNHHRQ